MLSSICSLSQTLHSPLSSGIPPTLVGEFSLETNISPSTSDFPDARTEDQARRTWYRLLFEAQIRAYSPSDQQQQQQVSHGWYFWTWTTEYDIDTWSYRRGIEDGWIPSDISNTSTYVYPLGEDGCVDAGFDYVAPLHAGAGKTAGEVARWWSMAVAFSVGILVI